MTEPGLTKNIIQGTVDLAAQNIEAEDKSRIKWLFGKIILAGLLIIGLTIGGIMLHTGLTFASAIATVTEGLKSAVVATVEFLSWKETKPRPEIVNRPDMPKEKEKKVESITKHEVADKIKENGGVTLYINKPENQTGQNIEELKLAPQETITDQTTNKDN